MASKYIQSETVIVDDCIPEGKSISALLPLNIAPSPMYPLTPPSSLALPSKRYKATPEPSENISVTVLEAEANVSPYRVVTFCRRLNALLKNLIWSIEPWEKNQKHCSISSNLIKPLQCLKITSSRVS